MNFSLNINTISAGNIIHTISTMSSEITSLDLSGHENACSSYDTDKLDRLSVGLKILPKQVDTIDFSKSLYLLNTDQIVALLKNIPESVTAINLSGCFTDCSEEDLIKIYAAIPRTITKLDLSENDISPNAIKELPPTLTSLHLSFCVIFRTPRLVTSFPELPPTLRYLNLSNNNLYFVNKEILIANIKKLPPNLVYLDLCNCLLPDPETFMEVIKALPQSVAIINLAQEDIDKLSGENLVNFLTVLSTNRHIRWSIDSNKIDIDEFLDKHLRRLKEKVLTALDDQLPIIQKKAEQLFDRKCDKAYIAANQLSEKINELKNQYKEDRIDYLIFKQQAKEAINEARIELEKHRGWKQVLGNLGLCILGCGVFYAALCLYNRSFFQFSTDSTDKLDALQSTINDYNITR